MLAISRIFVYLILAILTFFCIFFFYLLIVNSTRSNADLNKGFRLLPSKDFLTNFVNAWNDASINIPRGMVNSFIIAFASSVLTTYFSALTAFGIHCYEFKLKKAAFTFILAIMMIPSQISAVGFVKMCNVLGLTNNYIPLIVPGIAAPVVFFYMKQYMESILPLEIVEASRVDGASEFYTFNKIVLPIMGPAIAVQMIFSFVASWNNFFIPGMIIDKADLKTVPIMIAALRSADYAKFDMGKVYMLILLSILPVIVVYLFLSRFIIKGVSEGSVKG
ncbi:MAG: carbohydrate ABC transporter permease [Lachnospiraceae bacterium]|nr:carbohydrate ABC transporter permease [Lachnospiraceae bacterium]